MSRPPAETAPNPSPQKPIIPSPQSYANTLTTPSGAEHHLVLSEGIYTARDEITLGAVPTHPNYQQTISNNPLDPKVLLPTSPAVLSTTSQPPVKYDTQFDDSFQLSSSLDRSSPSSPPPIAKTGSSSRFKYLATGNLKAYVAQDPGSAGLSTAVKESKDPIKRRKPKNSLARSNSSLISRAIAHEGLAKRLNERSTQEPFAFVNNSRSFLWLDMSSSQKADQLTKIMFTKGNPLCHDVNLATLTPAPKHFSHIDVIVGFSTADIMWYEPMSQKYSRLNKRGVINESAISSIKWVPESENLFIAAHYDGTVVLYDKEREDATFTAEEVAKQTVPSHPPVLFEVWKSQKSRQQKTNPVALFKVTKQKINAIECSPDGRFVAIVSDDGSLRIMDLLKEELTDVYRSYYGGLTCVAWSPDGKYVLTGGEDDLVSLWSFEDRNIVARCRGHQSFVAHVAFDPWKCDDMNYRFGSVGEDSRLLLWDYSGSVIGGPTNSSIRPSVSSTANLPGATQQAFSTSHLSEDSSMASRDSASEDEASLVHFAEPRAAVTMLPPIFSKALGRDPLAWLGFQETTLIVSDTAGRIKTFERPT